MYEQTTETADAQRQRLNAETEGFLSAVGAILVEIAPDDRIVRWNDAAAEMLGLAKHAAIGASAAGITLPWRGALVLDAVHEVRRTLTSRRIDDLPYTTPDQASGTLTMTVSPVDAEPGTVPRVVLLAVDVTRRRSLEEHAARSLKFEALGVLAAGVAHEINGPLQFVTDNLHFLSDTIGRARTAVAACKAALEGGDADGVPRALAALGDADLTYCLEESERATAETFEGVDRVTNLVRSMREFSHTSPRALAPLDLNHLLQMTITLTRHEWKYSAEVETAFAPDLPFVVGCRDDLQVAFMNLLLNAARAIAERFGGGPDRGTLRVATSVVGDRVVVRISDTGTGIHPQVLGRVFDPFFTTKPVGEGAGQGLAITRTIIEKRHRGQIKIESEYGVGTHVDVVLPIDATACDAA
jgi:signal transduction histidine kinase